jgi:hypothetical protein
MACEYACPGCGFFVYSEPPGGSFVICRICGWEDDDVQLDDPFYQGGANGISLANHRELIIQRFPVSIQEHAGYKRDPAWHPFPAQRLSESPPDSN